MKGCLTFIIKTVIAVFVFFGLVHLGVVDYIKEKINEKTNPPQEKIVDKAKDIVDLSEIDDEYSLERSMKFLKNAMIIAEHNATGQKMIMIEPRKEDFFTKDDIKSEKVEEKLKNAATKYKHQFIKFDKIEVTKHGEMNGLGQKIPYAKAEVEISNLPVKDMVGIIGVAELPSGKNLLIISVNEKGKYSQIITDGFYKKVKTCKENTEN